MAFWDNALNNLRKVGAKTFNTVKGLFTPDEEEQEEQVQQYQQDIQDGIQAEFSGGLDILRPKTDNEKKAMTGAGSTISTNLLEGANEPLPTLDELSGILEKQEQEKGKSNLDIDFSTDPGEEDAEEENDTFWGEVKDTAGKIYDTASILINPVPKEIDIIESAAQEVGDFFKKGGLTLIAGGLTNVNEEYLLADLRNHGISEEEYKKDLIKYSGYKYYHDEGYINDTVYEEALDDLFDKYKEAGINFKPYIPDVENVWANISGNEKKIFFNNLDYLTDLGDRIEEVTTLFGDEGVEGNESWLNSSIESKKNTYIENISKMVADNVAGMNMGPEGENLNAQQYADASAYIGRLFNNLTPAYMARRKLAAKYGGDLSGMSEEDKETLRKYNTTIKFAEKVLANHQKYYEALNRYIGNSGDEWYVPDKLEGKTLHEWLMDGTENELADMGYLDKESTSSLDHVNQLARDVMFDYSMNNSKWLSKKYWTAFQYFGADVGDLLNEVGQQSFGKALSAGYGLANGGDGGIKNRYNAMQSFIDEDYSTLGFLSQTLNPTKNLLNSFGANTFEYIPEIAANTAAVIFGTKSIDKLLAVNRIAQLNRLLRGATKGAKTLSDAMKLTKGRIIRDTALNNILVRIPTNLMWDQFIDATISPVDNEWGSTTSFRWSVLGTGIGQTAVDLINAFDGFKGIRNLLGWGGSKDGTVWNMFKTLNNDQLDEYLRKTIGNDPNKLATWNNIRESARFFGKIESAVEGMAKLDQFKDLLNPLGKGLKDVIGNMALQAVNGESAAGQAILRSILEDPRTNPADVIKYIFGVNGTVKVGPWQSIIKLDDGGRFAIQGYNTDLDLMFPGGRRGFLDKLEKGFTKADMDRLKEANYGIAGDEERKKYFEYNDATGTYYLNRNGMRELANKNVISANYLDNTNVVKVSKDAEDFDAMMRGRGKLSDELLDEMKRDGTFDTLADALNNTHLCKEDISKLNKYGIDLPKLIRNSDALIEVRAAATRAINANK